MVKLSNKIPLLSPIAFHVYSHLFHLEVKFYTGYQRPGEARQGEVVWSPVTPLGCSILTLIVTPYVFLLQEVRDE